MTRNQEEKKFNDLVKERTKKTEKSEEKWIW